LPADEPIAASTTARDVPPSDAYQGIVICTAVQEVWRSFAKNVVHAGTSVDDVSASTPVDMVKFSGTQVDDVRSAAGFNIVTAGCCANAIRSRTGTDDVATVARLNGVVAAASQNHVSSLGPDEVIVTARPRDRDSRPPATASRECGDRDCLTYQNEAAQESNQ
jgi:hypothetical protein